VLLLLTVLPPTLPPTPLVQKVPVLTTPTRQRSLLLLMLLLLQLRIG
jgi:hypothetical protein